MISLPKNSQPYQAVLKEEFERRQNRNPRYSAGAYARFLGISASALSKVLSGSGNLSLQTALRVVSKLGLDKAEAFDFLVSLAKESDPSKEHKKVRLHSIDCTLQK